MIKTLSYHKDEVFCFCSFTGEVSSCSFQGCNLAAKADYIAAPISKCLQNLLTLLLLVANLDLTQLLEKR